MTELPPYPPSNEVGEILITESEIQERVAELGQRLAADSTGHTPLLVGILKGSVLFMADLVRAIPGPVEMDFLAVSSYGNETQSSGVVKILKDLDRDIAGRHVVIVEDIIDSGLTMAYLQEYLSTHNPATIRTCTLLLREGEQAAALKPDYVGFEIPPAFVVGYGLDVGERYRNLPYIAIYNES